MDCKWDSLILTMQYLGDKNFQMVDDKGADNNTMETAGTFKSKTTQS